jgi:hypothetical protein
LIERTVQAFEGLAQPVDYKGANGVNVSLDGEQLLKMRTHSENGVVTARDQEIAAAISRLRQSVRQQA